MCKGKGVHEENSRFRFVKPQSERTVMKKKELKKRIEKLEQQINKFAKDMEFVHSDSEIYNQLLTKACNDCAMLELKTDKRLKALEQQVKLQHKDVYDLRTEVAHIRESIGVEHEWNNVSVLSQLSDLKELEQKLTTLKETLTWQGAEIAELRDMLANKDIAIEELEQKLDSSMAAHNAAEARFNRLEQKVSNLEPKNQILSGQRQKGTK